MKVSDFVAEFLTSRGINVVYSVTGGYAMHLNDSFGKAMRVYYSHGENPCGYSALGHVKASQQPVVVCVTAGCGATNAITPCLIAYQDSAPVFFISGQVNRDENIRFLNSKKSLALRTFSGSDCDIIEMVKPITKFACELWDPRQTKAVLEECLHHLMSGRPGPVWLAIPLNVQGALIPDSLPSFPIMPSNEQPELASLTSVLDFWRNAKRPLVLIGNGVRCVGATQMFQQFVEKHSVPFVVSFLASDVITDSDPLYIGRVGVVGDRAGNFAIQNCDMLLCLGCRLSKSIVGYRSDWFAREAKIVMVDIDTQELNKPSCEHVIKILMNLKEFIGTVDLEVNKRDEWLACTQRWRRKWFRELPPVTVGELNPYTFLEAFYRLKPAGGASVASSGSLFCVVWHMLIVKPGDRFISSSHGDMGFEVPAAIGACICLQAPVYCMVGDGSFQLNLQELQTMKDLNLPVKVLYFNNGGYGAIKITQNQFFEDNEFGVSPASGIGFPNIQRVCGAFDIKYFNFDSNSVLDSELTAFYDWNGPCLAEVKCCIQPRFPKLSNKLMPDGTFKNLPLEDMAPFLDREEFRKEMCIVPVSESDAV